MLQKSSVSCGCAILNTTGCVLRHDQSADLNYSTRRMSLLNPNKNTVVNGRVYMQSIFSTRTSVVISCSKVKHVCNTLSLSSTDQINAVVKLPL